MPRGGISPEVKKSASAGQKGARRRPALTKRVPRPRTAGLWRPSRVGRLELKIQVIK